MTNSAVHPMVGRLEQRMSKLADTASKESIQALAKWIGFRRKYVKSFSKSLADAIENPSKLKSNGSSSSSGVHASAASTTTRQWLYLQILHEAIILDSGTSRWERLAEMREILGDALVDVAKSGCLDWATVKKVEVFVKQWDTLNVFGGPTLLNVIKKQLSAPSSAKTMPKVADSTTAAASTLDSMDTEEKGEKASKTTPASPKRSKSPVPRSPKRDRDGAPKIPPNDSSAEEDPAVAKETPVQASPPKVISSKSEPTAPTVQRPPKKEVTYDFESKNIPYGKVDSKAFIDPCTAIATLQIARDLRNDTAVQLSSLLKALPEDIKALCEEADQESKESGEPYELPADKARELSMRTSEKLLDMDLDEQLQNARTFLEIVGNQREARQRLIYLLIRSRCRFGANEAAEAFTNLEQTMKELQERKGTLLDAMALEGLDFEEESKEEKDKIKQKEQELAPLTWYKPEKETTAEEPDAKRAKVDDA